MSSYLNIVIFYEGITEQHRLGKAISYKIVVCTSLLAQNVPFEVTDDVFFDKI